MDMQAFMWYLCSWTTVVFAHLILVDLILEGVSAVLTSSLWRLVSLRFSHGETILFAQTLS